MDLSGKGFGEVPSSSGIYLLRWVRNNKPVPVTRIGGIDLQGILYIGKTKKLKRRIRSLWRAISKERPDAHTVGKTIILSKFFELVKNSEYEITWELTKHEQGQEWAAMVSYAQKYKELPPLNLLVGREAYAIFGIAKFGKARFAYDPDDFVKAALDV